MLAEFRSFASGPLEDYAALLLRFDGGAAGSLVLSAGAAGRKNQLLFELEGTKAGFTWDQEEPNELLFRPADGPAQIVVKDPAHERRERAPLSRYPAGHGEGYGGAFRNLFAHDLRGDRGPAARRRSRPSPTATAASRRVEAAVASARAAPGSGRSRTSRRSAACAARPQRAGSTNASAISSSDAASSRLASAFTSGVIPNLTCV